MSTVTGKVPANTYKDILQVSNSNAGIDATLRPVEDYEGTESPLYLSSTKGKWQPSSNSTSVVQFCNAAGTPMFTFDSTNGKMIAESGYTWEGNGANLTGITGATGGISNTGATNIIADSDGDGAGNITFTINATDVLTVVNDGAGTGASSITLANVATFDMGDVTTLDFTGAVNITSGANGDITLSPNGTGAVGINNNAPATGLHYTGEIFRLADTEVDALTKNARIGTTHYTTAEEPTAIAVMVNSLSSNVLNLGGGSGSFNTATTVNIRTAANTTTTTGIIALTVDASQNVDVVNDLTAGTIASDATITANSNYVLEGYSTGRNVLRSMLIRILPGATPGTNLTITELDGTSFNQASITDATDVDKSGTSGSWSVDAAGEVLTLNIAENIVGVLSYGIFTHDLNSSSTTEMYTIHLNVNGNNLEYRIRKRGTVANVDWTTILDAADRVEVLVSYVTSS